MTLSDKEYLELQFLQLDASYENEISCIKNLNNKLLHISTRYANEFNLDKAHILGQDMCNYWYA